MLSTRTFTSVLVVTLLVGSVSIAAARDWDTYYNHRPNRHGDFTNREAWSATIVNLGPGWFGVARYDERIRVYVIGGRPRLYMGQRVRIVPFERNGKREIGELRLPELDFRPVGTVSYVERHVPKERPYRAYGRYARPRGGYELGIRIRRGPKYAPPRYDGRHPKKFRGRRWK